MQCTPTTTLKAINVGDTRAVLGRKRLTGRLIGVVRVVRVIRGVSYTSITHFEPP